MPWPFSSRTEPAPAARDAPRWTRTLRRSAVFVGAVGAFAVLATLLLPLALGGRPLARLVLRLTPALCGRLDAESVTLGFGSLTRALVGGTLTVHIGGLSLRDERGEILLSGDLDARLRLEDRGRSVAIEDLVIARGRWLMEGRPRVGLGLVAALRSGAACGVDAAVPERTPAEKKRAPASLPPQHAKSPAAEHVLTVKAVHLRAMDVSFSFPDWALDLGNTSTEGRFVIAWGGPRGAQLSFEARQASADTSNLRVGGKDHAWFSRVPFDHVSLTRVAVDPGSPDLSLDVEAARTGNAILAGRAVFRDVFVHGRPAHPGLALDARWTGFAAAARALEARWRALVVAVMGTDDVRLHATANGPFSALAATLEVDTEALSLAVRLAADRTLATHWSFRDFPTQRRLPAALVPLLGGRATGSFVLEAKLAAHLAEMSASLRDVSLRLRRDRPGPFPPVFVLRSSATSQNAGETAGESAGEMSLVFDLGRASLAAGTLTLDRLATTWRGARADVSARLGFRTRDGTPSVAARLLIAHADLTRAWPGGPFAGVLDAEARMEGDASDARLVLSFPGRRTVWLAGHALTVPSRTRAWLKDGERLGLEGLALTGEGGTRLFLAGDVVSDRDVRARLTASHLPVAWVAPFLPQSPPDLRGWVDANLQVSGAFPLPSWSGTLVATQLGAFRTGWPDLRVAFDGKPERRRSAQLEMHFHGGLGEELAFAGTLGVAPGAGSPRLTASVDATLQGFALPVVACWPRTPWPHATVNLSGAAHVRLDRAGLHGEARLEELRAQGGPSPFHNESPLVLSVEPGRLALAPVRLVAPGLIVEAQGALTAPHEAARERPSPDDLLLDASVTSQIQVALLSTALRRLVPVSLKGDYVALRARGRGSVRAPALHGELSVADPVEARWSPPGKPPLRLRLTQGRLIVEGNGVAAPFSLVLEGGRIEHEAGQVSFSARGTWRPGPPGSFVEGTLEAEGAFETARLGAWLPPGVPALAGPAHLQLRLGLAGNRLRPSGRLTAELLTATSPDLRGPVQVRHLALSAEDGHWRLAPVEVTFAGGGPLRLAAEGDLDASLPRLSLRLEGRGVAAPTRLGPVDFSAADLDLQVRGPSASGRYRASGDVTLHGARVAATKPKTASSLTRSSETLDRWLARLDLDVHVKSPDTTAAAPGPDLSLAADCRVTGALLRPSSSGEVRGRGLYSRAIILLSDWLRGTHLRRCAP